MNPNGFLPSYDISFIVKNTSSMRRSIKIFNTTIGPGNQLDLMKLPGITEEIIRSELTKGYFKQLLSGGALTIVSCTVDLSSADSTHQSFLSSIGLANSASKGYEVSIYRDSEPHPKNNLFATWQDAYNAAFATNIPATIIIDDSLHPCSIPANSGDFDLHQITLAGLTSAATAFNSSSLLFINSGVTFNKGIKRVTDGLEITTANDNVALGTLTLPNPIPVFMSIDNKASFANGKSVPLFDLTNLHNTIFLSVDTGASLTGNGSGAEFFNIGNNNNVVINVFIGENAIVDQYAFAGSAGIIDQTIDPSANSLVTGFPNFSGQVNQDFIGQLALLQPFVTELDSFSLPLPGPGVPFNIVPGTMLYSTANSAPFWFDGSNWNTFPPPPPPSVVAASSFFAIMPTDNPNPIGSGVPIAFPRDGVTTGAGFGAPPVPGRDFNTNPDTNFVLPSPGVYQVFFQVSVTEPAQLVLTLDFLPLSATIIGPGNINTVVGRDTGNCQIVGMSLVETVNPNQILQVGNVANSTNTPLTLTASAGSNQGKPVSASLTIVKLK